MLLPVSYIFKLSDTAFCPWAHHLVGFLLWYRMMYLTFRTWNITRRCIKHLCGKCQTGTFQTLPCQKKTSGPDMLSKIIIGLSKVGLTLTPTYVTHGDQSCLPSSVQNLTRVSIGACASFPNPRFQSSRSSSSSYGEVTSNTSQNWLIVITTARDINKLCTYNYLFMSCAILLLICLSTKPQLHNRLSLTGG